MSDAEKPWTEEDMRIEFAKRYGAVSGVEWDYISKLSGLREDEYLWRSNPIERRSLMKSLNEYLTDFRTSISALGCPRSVFRIRVGARTL